MSEMPWKDIVKEAAKFGAGWMLAFYLVYMMVNRVAPAIEAVSGQMLTHAVQTSEFKAAIDRLIQINMAGCVNAARTEAQRERCLR